MSQVLRGPLTVLGRLLLCTIFLLAAVGNKIPHFSDVAGIMESVGVPAPQLLLAGAIVFVSASAFPATLSPPCGAPAKARFWRQRASRPRPALGSFERAR